MKHPNKEQQRQLVKQWETTGKLLEELRKEALRDMPYDWHHVDALLDLGVKSGFPSRDSSGMVEMQRRFREIRERTQKC